MSRIYLSPPDVGTRERELLLDAFDSNWIAPLGPHIDAFEVEIAQHAGRRHAVATSSGTAALHLALRYYGVGAGDTVMTSTLTFAATANAICYQGAKPVFIDSCGSSWNMDPELLHEALVDASNRGTLPKAVVPVDLYGQCANYRRICEVCAEFEIPVIADAAESIGALFEQEPAGSFGEAAIFSFNGNKIITTSGGGMLVTNDALLAQKAKFWATQARDPAPHYQHTELGYNYRLSNLLAAVGRAQLQGLATKVDLRRKNNQQYREQLGDLPGIQFMPEAAHSRSTFWLTTLLVDPELSAANAETIRLALESQDIECRPVWKPMHLQPLYGECKSYGGAVAERLFQHGLCLPSGSSLSDAQHARVTAAFRSAALGL